MSLPSIIRLAITHPRIVIATTTANWNSGVATSGLAGADLFIVGAPGLWYLLNFGAIVSTGFNVAATVTYRLYSEVAGVMMVTDTDDIAMPEDLILLSWWLDTEMYGPLRCEVFSDQAADDGLAVTYEYRIKNW